MDDVRESSVTESAEGDAAAKKGLPHIDRLRVMARPCGPCPWVCANADRYRYANLAEYAEGTIPDLGFGSPTQEDPHAPLGALFVCHHDPGGRLCASHVAVVGKEHPLVRLAIAMQLIDPAALEPGADWPELYATYHQMIEAASGSSQHS